MHGRARAAARGRAARTTATTRTRSVGSRYDFARAHMIVTEIEVHAVECLHHEWIRDTLDHYYENSKRFIYIAHTDTGLTGLGEGEGDQSAVIEKYIGTNPFQWIGDNTSLALGTAMYDLMGKAVGVPVWQLVGPRHRAYVPVGSWTVSAAPAHMAEAVQRYAAQGYTWMKYHLSPFQNVFDQVEAMAAVAPPGFKLHLDFTMEPLEAHTHLCERLAQCVHPCTRQCELRSILLLFS